MIQVEIDHFHFNLCHKSRGTFHIKSACRLIIDEDKAGSHLIADLYQQQQHLSFEKMNKNCLSLIDQLTSLPPWLACPAQRARGSPPVVNHDDHVDGDHVDGDHDDGDHDDGDDHIDGDHDDSDNNVGGDDYVGD